MTEEISPDEMNIRNDISNNYSINHTKSYSPLANNDSFDFEFNFPEEDNAKNKPRSYKGAILWVFIGIIILFLTFLTFYLIPWIQIFTDFFEYVENLGLWGNLLMMSAFVLISFPFTFGYIPLSLGAGYLYGVLWGTITSAIGSNFGAMLCFIVVRQFFRPFCYSKLQNIPQAKSFIDTENTDGIKFYAAVIWRMAPVPFGFSNALFALSSIPFLRYALSTILGLLPFQVMWVYLGTTLRSLTEAASGNIEGSTPQIISLILQLFAGVAVPIYLYLRSKKKDQNKSEPILPVINTHTDNVDIFTMPINYSDNFLVQDHQYV